MTFYNCSYPQIPSPFARINMKAAILALLGLSASAWAAPAPFSVEDMLAAPRPFPAIASPDKQHAIAIVDYWEPKDDSYAHSEVAYGIKLILNCSMRREAYLATLNRPEVKHPISLFNTTPSAAADFFWLDNVTIAYLDGSTLFSYPVEYAFNQSNLKSKHHPPRSLRHQKILSFPSGVNPTSLQYEASTKTLAFTGQVWSDGSFYQTGHHDKLYRKKRDSAQVYDDLMVRHWDTWRVSGKVWTLGVVKLSNVKGEWAELDSDTSKHHKHRSEFINILNGTDLVSQTDPIDAGSYSISSDRIAVAVKPPYLLTATHTREDIYLFPLPSSYDSASSPPKHLTPHAHGAISGVKFSPDGKKLSWLEMKKDGYESDRRVAVVYDLEKGKSERWTDVWNRSPSSISVR